MKPNFNFMGQRPDLAELPPLTVVELTGEEFGKGLTRRELALAADRLLRELQRGDGLPNDDSHQAVWGMSRTALRRPIRADFQPTRTKAPDPLIRGANRNN